MPSYRHRNHVALALHLILVTSILATSPPAVARRVESSGGTERQKRTQARALFAQAESKYRLGQLGEALDLYAKAYEVLPLPGQQGRRLPSSVFRGTTCACRATYR